MFRDFTHQTPLETLGATLVTDLEKIWAALSKPEHSLQAKITDYFDFAFHAVAHKIYAHDQFLRGLESLRSRFFDMGASDYLLKPAYHKGIPADGFPHYAAGIWDKVVHNRDLDLPTEQILLSQYRCDELAKSAFKSFSLAIKHFKPLLDAGGAIKTLCI